jgi:hypothetical protein
MSRWIGTAGDRIIIEAAVIQETTFDNKYGRCNLYRFEDANGNLYIHMGPKIYVDLIDSYPKDLAKGDKVRLSADIKEHVTWDGSKQTVVRYASRADYLD